MQNVKRNPALVLSSQHFCQKRYEYHDVLHVTRNLELILGANKMAAFNILPKFKSSIFLQRKWLSCNKMQSFN